MDVRELAAQAEGVVPAELLTETELKSGLLSTHRIPVANPFASYLEDGEQPHHVVPTGEVTESGSYHFRGGSNAQHGIAVLTDHRLLVAVGDDDPPLAVRYEDVKRVMFSYEGSKSSAAIRVGCDGVTYEFDYGGGKPVKGRLDDADGEVLGEEDVIDWLEQAVAEVNDRRERVDDRLDTVNAKLDHDNAIDGPVTADGMTALLDAHEAAIDVADDADGIQAIDQEDARDRVVDLEEIVHSRFGQWVEAIREDLSRDRLAAAANDAAAARELVARAPLPEDVSISHQRSLYDAELRARTRSRDDEEALGFVRDCLGRDGPPVDDQVAFVLDALVAAADRDEAAVAAQVAAVVPALGERRDDQLPSLVARLVDRRPALGAAVPPTAAAGLLHDDAPTVRRVGCELLAIVGTERELEALRDRQDDGDYDVRVGAMEAMTAIAEREDVTLTEDDHEQLREVNITYQGSGDVVAGDFADHSTAVEDSVVNRSTIGEGSDSGDGDDASGVVDGDPSFCPSCGSDFGEYDDPAFCPDCGFEL